MVYETEEQEQKCYGDLNELTCNHALESLPSSLRTSYFSYSSLSSLPAHTPPQKVNFPKYFLYLTGLLGPVNHERNYEPSHYKCGQPDPGDPLEVQCRGRACPCILCTPSCTGEKQHLQDVTLPPRVTF